jgi:hypothetical protein
LRRSRFAWLRDYSESPAPSNIVALLDRLGAPCASGPVASTKKVPQPQAHLETAEISLLILQFL